MNELERIENLLRDMTGAFDLRPTIEKAADIGELLIEARSLVQHGEWAGWLGHLGLHRRSAWDYIAVAKARQTNVWPATQMTIKGFLTWVRRAKYQEREAERAEAREQVRQLQGALPDNINLVHSNCQEFDWPKKLDLIVADPPWNDLSHYQWISSWAARHLRDGGLALVQCGQHLLPEALSILKEHLTYLWTLSIVYSESSGTVAKGKFRSIWKPVLAFSRGKAELPETVSDAYHIHVTGTDKTLHAWEQPLAPWRYWLSRLAMPGNLVADPFAGSGTIAVACHELGLRYIGTELDQQTFRVARGRIRREFRKPNPEMAK